MAINQHCQKAVGVFKCITATHIFLYIKWQKCENPEQRFYSLQNNALKKRKALNKRVLS